MSRRHPAAEYLEAILVAVLLALFAKAFVFEAFEIPSSSMEATLLPGDHVLVDKFAHAPHAGPWSALLPYRSVERAEVLVFRYPEDPSRDFVKRVVGLPGDVLAMDRKVLVRDRAPVPEPWAIHKDSEVYPAGSGAPEALLSRDGFGPLAVPPGSLFMLGDNRDDSRDSRFWGPLPAHLVKGRAVLVYWSFAPERRFTGRGAGLRRLVDTAIHFFGRTRWDRTLRRVR